MVVWGKLIDRCKYLLTDPLLDTDDPAWLRATVGQRLNDAITGLARQGLWGTMTVVQAMANRALYPLNEQAILLIAGRDNGGGTNNLTDLTDTTVDFVTLGVAVNDRLRNLTDGAQGIITTVAATVLTCSAGVTGGVQNSIDSGDTYIVERPLVAPVVCAIDAVLYNGYELEYATEVALDRRYAQGWETRRTEPKYWTVDNMETPTVLHVLPPPRLSGSSVLRFPPAPFFLPWEDNLVLFLREQPQTVTAEDSPVALLDAYHDLLVWQAVSGCAQQEGQHQDLAVATVAREMGALWRQQLGISLSSP